MMWLLIGRRHIGGKNSKNSWSHLGRFLKIKITSIEPTKALALVASNSFDSLQREIHYYNQKYHTDFFIERNENMSSKSQEQLNDEFIRHKDWDSGRQLGMYRPSQVWCVKHVMMHNYKSKQYCECERKGYLRY